MTSQRDAILAHLRAGNVLTAYDALARFRCLRLAARIAELRESGYAISAEAMKVGGKRVACYSMLENNNFELGGRKN